MNDTAIVPATIRRTTPTSARASTMFLRATSPTGSTGATVVLGAGSAVGSVITAGGRPPARLRAARGREGRSGRAVPLGAVSFRGAGQAQARGMRRRGGAPL